jgi:hypothetical protein
MQDGNDDDVSRLYEAIRKKLKNQRGMDVGSPALDYEQLSNSAARSLSTPVSLTK